ncbi:hypothetical protein LguiA_031364 [Lonicera macranthoides]
MTITIKSLELHSYALYDVTFFDDTIKTLVTRTPCLVFTWISDMKHLHHQRLRRLTVGLDIEWLPNSCRNQVPNPPATLQLCVGSNCLIFQLLFAPEIPQSLKNFLADTNYTFVGVEIDRDVEKLRDSYGLEVQNTVDLRGLAADRTGKDGMRSRGLVNIAKEVLGKDFEKPKNVSWSNWAADWLSLDQIQYACVDAFVSFEIGKKLKASNSNTNIRHWNPPWMGPLINELKSVMFYSSLSVWLVLVLYILLDRLFGQI